MRASAVRGQALPAAVVDLNAFDSNVRKVVALSAGKTIRLASKSIRVPQLLKRAIDSSDAFRGVLCFCVQEALLLWKETGLDDFLIAYPTFDAEDLSAARQLVEADVAIALMVDSVAGVRLLSERWRGAGASVPLDVCVDVDLSLRVLGLHLGVRRSPVRSADEVVAVAKSIEACEMLNFAGVMGYEAQVAGLPDSSPFVSTAFNFAARLVRSASAMHSARMRARINDRLRAEKITFRLFNGGGTGSLDWAVEEPALTEITVGSALFAPHLFDYYSNVDYEPALFFVLQVVRQSDPSFATCSGGGYVASGPPGWDRLPLPVFPKNLELISEEGAGEVQTPLRSRRGGASLKLGDGVTFRPAKAGELAERFSFYHLVSDERIVGRASTYRGLGATFF